MIAERLSARHLILQYSLAVHCTYALECNYNYGDFCYIIDDRYVLSGHACTVYMYLVWNVEKSWPGFENEGRGKEVAEKYAVSMPGCISKHQELVRRVSEG